jgi:hypothetical protein
VLSFSLLLIFLLFQRVLLVPEEFPNLQAAISFAKDGDSISYRSFIYGLPHPDFERGEISQGKDLVFLTRDRSYSSFEFVYPPLREVRPLSGWVGAQPVNRPGSHFTVGPHIAFHPDGNPWAVWYGKDFDNEGSLDIFYTRWNGSAWNLEQMLNPPDTLNDTRPTIAIDESGRIFVVWSHDYTEGWPAYNDIYYSVWDGIGWQSPLPVASSTAYEDFAPVISSGGGETWVTWYRAWLEGYTGYEVYASHWNGSSWDPEVMISRPDYGQTDEWYAYCVVDREGHPHFVWSEYYTGTIWYRTYDGDSWSDPIAIVDTTSEVRGFDPAIAVDDEGNLHVVFTGHVLHNPTDLDIYYTKSTDGGLTWSYPEMVNEDDEYYDQWARIALISFDNVWITWYKEYSLWVSKIYAIHLKEDTWSQIWRLDGDETQTDGTPTIALDPQNHPWVTWNGIAGPDPIWDPFTIFYNRYVFSGVQYFGTKCEEGRKVSEGISHIQANTSSTSFNEGIVLKNTISVGRSSVVPVTLEIYDISGRKVMTLEREFQGGIFEGIRGRKDDVGNFIRSGVYIVRFKIGSSFISKKFILAR